MSPIIRARRLASACAAASGTYPNSLAALITLWRVSRRILKPQHY